MIRSTTIASAFGPESLLRDFFDRAYCRLKLSGKSINTKRLYDVTLRNFDNYLGRAATLADLNDDTVTAHIGWYLERGRSPRTGNKARDQLCAIWRFAARKRFVNEWPDVEPLSEYKRTPTAWTPEQFSRLVAVAASPAMVSSGRNLPHAVIYGIPTVVWWPALLLVIYDTGIRIGAALQLKCSDYTPQTRRLHVRAETQKTRADQDFILSEQTAEMVEACISSTAQRELLFHCSFVTSLYYRFKTLLRKAGLPHGRTDKFHRIRKTSATMAELHCGPGTAQRLLDHSSPRMTNDHYLDQSMLPTAAIAEKLPRPVINVAQQDLEAISLDGLLLDYIATFRGDSRSRRSSSVPARVRRLVEQCGMKTVADLNGGRLLAAIAVRMKGVGKEKPLSALSADDYRQACRRFMEWLIGHRGILGPTLEAFSLLSDPNPQLAKHLAENADLLAIGGATA